MIWQRFSSWPFADKRKLQSPLQFSAALRVLRGQMCCRCSSSWPFVGKRKLQSPLQFSAALRVLRGQRCCRCRSSWPLVSFVDQKRCSSWPSVALRGQKEAAVAVTVLRGPPCPPWTNVLPLQFFVALRGPSWTKGSCSRRCSSPRPSVSSVDKCVAVEVLRGPPWPFVDKRKLQSPLQFSAALRVLRGQMCCRCSSSWPSVALRGQKEVAVAVAVLRGPQCPPWTNVLPLQFFVALRGPSWTKGSCSRRCSSPRPSVSSVDKCVAVAVLRGPSWAKGSCSRRCSSPRPSVSSVDKCVAVAGLRGPSWTKGSCSRRCSSPRPSVSSVDKCVAVAGLRGPSWPFVDKRFPPHSPFEDRPNYDLAYLSSDKRQRALVTPPVRGISLSPLPYPLPPAVLAFEAGLRPCEPIRR